jgi:hypothetical protein
MFLGAAAVYADCCWASASCLLSMVSIAFCWGILFTYRLCKKPLRTRISGQCRTRAGAVQAPGSVRLVCSCALCLSSAVLDVAQLAAVCADCHGLINDLWPIDQSRACFDKVTLIIFKVQQTAHGVAHRVVRSCAAIQQLNCRQRRSSRVSSLHPAICECKWQVCCHNRLPACTCAVDLTQFSSV